MCTFKNFATEVETARLCRPKRRRCDQDYIDGYDAQYYIRGPHGLTDKASDFELDDLGFESLCGQLLQY